MTTEYVKKLLEPKLGSLTNAEVNFVIEQYERNAVQAQRKRKVSTVEILTELELNLNFYRKNWR